MNMEDDDVCWGVYRLPFCRSMLLSKGVCKKQSIKDENKIVKGFYSPAIDEAKLPVLLHCYSTNGRIRACNVQRSFEMHVHEF